MGWGVLSQCIKPPAMTNSLTNWLLWHFIVISSSSQPFPSSSTQNQVELSEWATGCFMHCCHSLFRSLCHWHKSLMHDGCLRLLLFPSVEVLSKKYTQIWLFLPIFFPQFQDGMYRAAEPRGQAWHPGSVPQSACHHSRGQWQHSAGRHERCCEGIPRNQGLCAAVSSDLQHHDARLPRLQVPLEEGCASELHRPEPDDASHEGSAEGKDETRGLYRAHSRFASSQWETTLLCNDVSHWLGVNLVLAFCNDVSRKPRISPVYTMANSGSVETLYNTISGIHEIRSCYRRIVTE